MTDTEIGHPEGARGEHDQDGRVDSTAALRTVIQMSLRTDLRRVLSGCPIEQSGLRENLRSIGAHARRHRLRAEQLLILIKESCASLPEARELLAKDRQGALDQLISMAVQEYYGPADAPSSPST
ncbi:MAG TPA: hypothetical protein VK511_06005 [Gemmatimonadaceae bacterium]|nr:hypothetical protein [Gemmatimonadaceae bacterium]